jgi:hypothetical protein
MKIQTETQYEKTDCQVVADAEFKLSNAEMNYLLKEAKSYILTGYHYDTPKKLKHLIDDFRGFCFEIWSDKLGNNDSSPNSFDLFLFQNSPHWQSVFWEDYFWEAYQNELDMSEIVDD